MRFYRGSFAQIAIAIQTNEALGILHNSVVQDIDGIDGQLSVVSSTGVKRSFLVGLVSNNSNGCLLQGRINLSLLTDGLYYIKGICKDILGNVTNIFQELEIRNGEQFVPTMTSQFKILVSDYNKPTKIPTDVAAQRLRVSIRDRYRLKFDRFY